MNDNDISRCLSKIFDAPIDVSKMDDREDLRIYGLNSIKAIELIINLEEALCVEVNDEDLTIDNVSTVGKIKSLINKYDIAKGI